MARKELEVEFSEFLIQKIKHTGGSLPLQHLYGIVQYATFEMRKEYGTTKLKLMKFLKTHSEKFSIDPSGMVTVKSSTNDPSDDDDDDNDSNDDDDFCDEKSTANVIKNIENGFGIVSELHPEFGIIKAFEPIETLVYFKSDVFSGYQDKLLTDCLQVGLEVFFNAVYGHDVLDIKFRATKIWIKCDRNVTIEKALNNFEGDGVIQKIMSDEGFILVPGKKKETIFFTKNSVIDRNDIELAKFFNVGDPVSFSATKRNEKDSKCQWQATVVKKKFKEKMQSTSLTKIKAAVHNRIENELGKIYPHSHGAVIKFRNNELADGDSSYYFFYGIEVSDIAFEFSEGDDVLFDAIKTKSAPGWKALCVWVGEKPEYVNTKVHSDVNMQKISDKSSTSCEKSNSTVSLKSKTLKSECDTHQQIQSKSTVCDRAVDKDTFEHESECKRQHLKSHGGFQTFPAEKSNRRGGTKSRKEILPKKKKKKSKEKTTSETHVKHRPNPKNSTVNRLKDTRLVSNMEMDDTSSHSDKNYDDDLSYKDEGSNISERSFQDDEFQDMLQKNESFLNERDESFESESENGSVHYDENEIDSVNNEIKHYKSSLKGRPSIKTFENIDGEIIILYCKAAIVKSSELQRNVDFFLNVFYIDGKSVEEQQVIDLKEVIKVGDHVNINCFEIIDDFGEIHQKVTLAWKGLKPNVHEMTAKEFIEESELCVTLSDELDSAYLIDEREAFPNSPEETFEETATIIHGPVEANKENFEEKNSSVDTHKLLSEKIIHGLRSKGIIPADLQVDFSDMLTQVISLTEKHSSLNNYKNDSMNEENVEQIVCSACGEKKYSIFCGKNKSEKHAASQTIITGGIIAQSIYTQT